MQQVYETNGRRVILRPVTPADAAGTIALVQGIAAEGIYFVVEPAEVRTVEAQVPRITGIDPENEFWMVAEVDGEIVGQVDARRRMLTKARHVAELGIGIAPAYRNLGLGPKLMLAAEDWARQAGVRKLTLGVFASNERARRLYERIGYAIEGVQKGQFLINGAYVDDIIMAKWLGD